MSIYGKFATDKQAELEGIELNYGKNEQGEDMIFVTARIGGNNIAYQKAMESLSRPFARKLRTGTITDEESRHIMFRAFFRGVLKGWSGIRNRNGDIMVFNEENTVTLFTDLPDLYQDISRHAQDMQLFREQAVDDDSKN